MNIEELIPKETFNRKAYIKNVLLDKLPIGIGLNAVNIVYNFITDRPLKHNIEYIEYNNLQLFTRDCGNTWTIISDDPRNFLPKEWLLEEWKVF